MESVLQVCMISALDTAHALARTAATEPWTHPTLTLHPPDAGVFPNLSIEVRHLTAWDFALGWHPPGDLRGQPRQKAGLSLPAEGDK